MTVPLQTPRPAQELVREFAIKSGLRLVLDEVLYPVRIITDRPRKYVMGQTGITAAAGLRAEVALVNAIPFSHDQDTTVLIHKIWLQSPGAIEAQICWPTTAQLGLTTVTDVRFLDASIIGVPRAVMGQDVTAVATAAVPFARIRINGAQESKLVDFDDHPLIIRSVDPRGLLVRPSVDETSIIVNILWSEPADPA